MDWKRYSHPIERAAIAFAGLSLGGATAFAMFTLAPFAGVALTGAAGVGGLTAALGGMILLKRVGEPATRERDAFRLIDFVEMVGEHAGDEGAEVEGEAEELLLDDPITSLDPESRVVRLFQREQPPEPLPEPGEMVTRITSYLDSGRGGARLAVNAAPVLKDAGAALHAALADIRKSLR